MYQIIEKKQLNNDVFSMKILAPRVAKNAKPGHFVVIRNDEVGERIPLTICSSDSETGLVELVIQTIGYSTKKLALKNAGDSIMDIMGPLGKASPIHSEYKRILGVAGGVGAAPILPQLIAYHNLGAQVDYVVGGRTDKHLIMLDRFNEFATVYPCTNDGSLGHKGFVTEVMKELLEKNKYDEVIIIGPAIMMKVAVGVAKEFNVPCMVSLNPIMIDGTGMCGECRVSINGEPKFACVDGPDFDGYAVNFDELMRRQGVYKKEESHICNLKEALLHGSNN